MFNKEHSTQQRGASRDRTSRKPNLVPAGDKQLHRAESSCSSVDRSTSQEIPCLLLNQNTDRNVHSILSHNGLLSQVTLV
jgi:hypothetical protein